MNDRRMAFNIGDALHVLQIAVLLIAMGVAYEKFNAAADASSHTADKVERIEHYLSSRDPNYWRLSTDP
jgi:hypothetical protein